MNVLINTPLLRSQSLKKNFDNKIIIVFLGLIFALVILGLLFVDITQLLFSSASAEDPTDYSQFI